MQSEAITQSKLFLIYNKQLQRGRNYNITSPKHREVLCPHCQESYYCTQASGNFKRNMGFMGCI